jgi:hypothetical protein
MTLLAWYGRWEWPAWPAFAVIEIAFGTHTAFGELPFATRAAAVTLLIIVNVTFWGALARTTMRLFARRSQTPRA